MKSKVMKKVPFMKAKDMVLEKKLQKTLEEIEKAGEKLPKTIELGIRKMTDDKIRKAEARKEFDAEARRKLKNSRRR